MWKAAAALALAPSLVLSGAVRAELPASAPEAGLYRLSPARTRVLFRVSELGFLTVRGEFTGARGELDFDPSRPAASRLTVSVPIAGVHTHDADFDTVLAGPGWFDAARWPAMTFRSTLVTPTGPDTADVTGALTLHGVTRSVTFHTRFNLAVADPLTRAQLAGFEARGEIRRSDFGMTRDTPLVGDTVHIVVAANFVRANP